MASIAQERAELVALLGLSSDNTNYSIAQLRQLAEVPLEGRQTSVLFNEAGQLTTGPSNAEQLTDNGFVTQATANSTFTKVTEAPLNASRYATIQLAINALPSTGGNIFVPKAASPYLVTASLTTKNNVVWIGEGATSSIIRSNTATNALFSTSGLVLSNSFYNIALDSQAGHVFDLGTTGGWSLGLFQNCTLTSQANGVSIFYQNGTGDFVGNRFIACDFQRFVGATVPGFDMRNTNGGLNANSWENCRVTSNNASGTPYFRLRADAAGTYAYENVWRSITGELNASGLIAIDSPSGCTFDTVIDNDVSGAYSASLIKIGKAAGGYPAGVKASNCGNRGGTMSGAVYILEVTAATVDPCFIDRVQNYVGVQRVSFAGGYGASILDASGASGVLTTSTVGKTLDPTAEGIVVFNGASLTATLPDPTTLFPGRVMKVKNIAATALTVNSAGSSKTIDGSASVSLAQWAKGQYVTDGTQWLSV